MGNHWCVHLPDFLAEYGTIALEAQGYRRTLRQDPNRLSDLYDPGFIHADSDLTAIAAGLIESKAGRLRLYGPPGTGESAHARWLADQMGVPSAVKPASDFLSMYVGENEKNIARAFSDATLRLYERTHLPTFLPALPSSHARAASLPISSLF
jgi:hypothetical protein